MRSGRSGVAPDGNLRAGAGQILGGAQQLGSYLGVHVIFSAVRADLRRDFSHHERRIRALKRHRGHAGARLRISARLAYAPATPRTSTSPARASNPFRGVIANLSNSPRTSECGSHRRPQFRSATSCPDTSSPRYVSTAHESSTSAFGSRGIRGPVRVFSPQPARSTSACPCIFRATSGCNRV